MYQMVSFMLLMRGFHQGRSDKVDHSSFPPLLTSEHHALLNRWPFHHFLNLPQIGMSRLLIKDMFQRWDFLNSGFTYKGYLLQTTDDDFSLVLGLSTVPLPLWLLRSSG